MRTNLLSMFAILVLAVAPASATVIYDSIDNPLPGAYPSMGYEATSTSELGDYIAFTGTDRDLETVNIVMTSWACENDFSWNGESWVANRTGDQACITTPGSGFTHPITLNIYAVDNTSGTPQPGAIIATKTVDAFIPFRPSYDEQTECAAPAADVPFGGTWYDSVSDSCYHGYNAIVEFDFASESLNLPDEVIYGVAYDTANYGANPIGMAGPYSSLNYGLSTSAFYGTDIDPTSVLMDSTWSGAYCDAGANGTGTFRHDTGCWEGYVPTAQFNTGDSTPEVPEFGGLLTVGALGVLGAAFVARKRL